MSNPTQYYPTPPDVPGYVIGDCLEVLRTLPSGFAHCCVTSPPYYGLRDYGHAGQIGREPTLAGYVDRLVTVFAELRRVLRDDGTLWLNLGDSYSGSGVAGLPSKGLIGVPWRVALALQDDGWILRSDIIWHKPNPMPESVTDRPTKAHEYLFMLSAQPNYHYDSAAISERAKHAGKVVALGDKSLSKGQARGAGVAASGNALRDSVTVGGRRNKRSVWTVPTQPYAGAHFACFPPDLVKPCIAAGCPPGGVVIDPFFGSGTTGAVAEALGRQWFGIELNGDYEPLIRARNAQVGLI